MIINQSGIVIRLSVAECRVMGRATQGVRLINLAKKNDVIASVCKVMSAEMEEQVEEESRSQWNKANEDFKNGLAGGIEDKANDGAADDESTETAAPSVDFE